MGYIPEKNIFLKTFYDLKTINPAYHYSFMSQKNVAKKERIIVSLNQLKCSQLTLKGRQTLRTTNWLKLRWFFTGLVILA